MSSTDSLESPFGPGERRRGQTFALLTNLGTNVSHVILFGPMMILYATKVLGLDAARIAAIMGAAAALPFLQLLTMPLVPPFGKRAFITTNHVCSAALIACLLLLPSQGVLPRGTLFVLFAGLLLAIRATRSAFHHAAWQPLLRDITTIDDRGRFFARMRASFNATTLIFLLVCALTIGKDITPGQYRWMLAFALLLAVLSAVCSRGIPSCETRQAYRRVGVREYLRVLRTSPLFRLPLAIILIGYMGMLRMMVLYLSQVLHFPDSLVSLYALLQLVLTVLSLLFWGRITDRVGYRSALRGILFLYPLLLPLVVFMSPLRESFQGVGQATGGETVSIAAALGFALLLGALQAGLGVALTSIWHHRVSADEAVVALPLIMLILFAWEALLASVFGLVVHATIHTGALAAGPVHLDLAKLYVFAVVALLLGSAGLARRLPGVRATAVRDFYRAMLGRKPVAQESPTP